MDEKLRERIREAARAAVKPATTVVRKSAGQIGDAGGDKPYFSIAKYMRGAAKGNWGEADHELSVFKSLNASNTGSFLIPPEYSADFVDLLRAKAVVRSMGASLYPIAGDTLILRRLTGGATAYWVGQASGDTEKHESEPTLGQIRLVLKEVAGLVKVSNNLLADASPAADRIVKEDMVKVLGLAEDLAYIRGTGGLQPLGIYNDPAVPRTTLGAGNGAVPSYDDLLDAMYAIENANGTYTAWLVHPRSTNTLRKIKDGTGNYIYTAGDVTKGLPDTLFGLPVFKTTQIPTTLTFGVSGATCSFIVLGNWPEFCIGQKAGGIEVTTSTEAGTAFQNDETWFRATLRVDGVARQPAEFYIIAGVRP